MGVTLTDVLLFGKAQSDDVDNATFVIYRRNILRWSALGGYLDIIVKGISPLSLPDAIANSLGYLKAFGGTEQRNLPDGYIERQFIYMMDGSCLLTDIVPTYDCKVEMDFQTTSIPEVAFAFLGGRNSTSYPNGLQLAKAQSGFVVDGFGARYIPSPGVQPLANTRYKFTFNNKVATMESGGTTLFTNTFTNTDATGAALAINGLNNDGSVIGNNAGIYLYSFKAWNAQGELVIDLVPAVQKGTVPVVGFYDTVSKTFKTATAGTFAAGGEAVPTPDTPMDIVCNNGVLKARHQSGLPLGYTLLDYIESTGTQYIGTGITDVTDSEFILDMKANSIPSAFITYLGASEARNNMYKVPFGKASNNSLYTQIGTEDSGFTYGPSADTNRHSFRLITGTTSGGTYYVDNISYPFTYAIQNDTTLSLFLFARNNAGTASNFASMNCYGLKIKKSDVLVRNLIPAKRNSDNVVGMYDLVSGQFFTNQGTGDFVAGDPVSDPVEIYTDGTVETINVHGKNWLNDTNVVNAYNATGNYTHKGYFVTSISSYTNNPLYRVAHCVLPAGSYRFETDTANAYMLRYAIGSAVTELLSDNQKQYIEFTLTTTTEFSICWRNSTTTEFTGEHSWISNGATAIPYEPYFNGGTATAEMLLKVGDYQDVQSILDGVVTRKVGVKVLDGTEDWTYNNSSFLMNLVDRLPQKHFMFCTHFKYNDGSSTAIPNLCIGGAGATNTIFIKYQTYNTAEQFKQFLAAQYAAGTPVIVIYLLATPTTESVAGQTMQVQAGDNVVEITQASLDNLELEAKYQAAVSLTIQEVQDANLDPNVQVTIN